MSKNISLYIYFMLCIKINGHGHPHDSSHTTSPITNNNNDYNNQDSYNMIPKYEIIGNNNIIKDTTFKHFINSFLEKDEYYSIVVSYYISNIILESSNYYGECLIFNSQITENITIINIENMLDYDEPISYNDYKNNDIFSNMEKYCFKYQHEYSNNKSIFMAIFLFMLFICFVTECCGSCSYSHHGNNLY